MTERDPPFKNALLESFASYNAYEHGHSGGEDEVNNHYNGLRHDLQKVDDYIADLERQLLFAKVDAQR